MNLRLQVGLMNYGVIAIGNQLILIRCAEHHPQADLQNVLRLMTLPHRESRTGKDLG